MNIIADFYGQRLKDVYKINSSVNYDLKILFGTKEFRDVRQTTESLMSSNDGF